MLRRIAVDDPERVALVGADARLTYRGLECDARRLAAGIREADAASCGSASVHDPVVAVCVSSSFDAARLVVALEGDGAVFGVLDPHWPMTLQARLLHAIGATVLVTDDGDDARLRAAGWAGTTIRLADLARAATPTPRATTTDQDGFLLLFSSGTTGAPKAFLKTRTQYLANLAVSRDHLGALSGIATFAPGPLSYSLTLYALFESLATGGRIHVADRLEDLWLTTRVAEEEATRLVTVPAALHPLADAARRSPGRFDRLGLIVTGGAGLTETTRGLVAGVLPHTEVIAYYGAGELGFIGDSRAGDGIRLYPHVEAEVRDESGAPLAPGELGTLWVRSPSCSDRYLSAPPGPPLRDPDGWASVGDLGRLDGRTFTFAGRRGDVIATGGHKVALDEVERGFEGMPDAAAVCAIALPDARLGTVIGLVVEGDDLTRRTLRDWAASRLAPESLPRRWYSVAELPRTGGGKIRRDAVTALVSAGREARRL